jgi:hypothetical protein
MLSCHAFYGLLLSIDILSYLYGLKLDPLGREVYSSVLWICLIACIMNQSGINMLKRYFWVKFILKTTITSLSEADRSLNANFIYSDFR